MNEERYLKTALDELHNGGPSPQLEDRILQAAPVIHAGPGRWWLVPAACAVIALGVATVILFTSDRRVPRAEAAAAPVAVIPAQPPILETVAQPEALQPAPAAEEEPVAKEDVKEPVAPPPDFKPDPKARITLDFVQKDLHTVMHYIALRSGLQIIVEGEVNVKLTVMFEDVDPLEAIKSICKANNLDFIQDGSVIILKRRPEGRDQAHVVKAESPDVYTVTFEDEDVIAAIMEVATATKTEVFVPAIPEGEESRTRKINLHMKDATPDAILRKLAELGGMEIKVVKLGDGHTYKYSEPE